jgi:pilus assembly protein Flp/PilA
MLVPLRVAPASTRSGTDLSSEESTAMEGIICATREWLRAKLPAERGASMVEYAFLLALIAVVALVAVQTFGQGVSTRYSTINSSITAP